MSAEPNRVEASDGDCPTRTLWQRQADGLYRCECCGMRRRYDRLRGPAPMPSGDENAE